MLGCFKLHFRIFRTSLLLLYVNLIATYFTNSMFNQFYIHVKPTHTQQTHMNRVYNIEIHWILINKVCEYAHSRICVWAFTVMNLCKDERFDENVAISSFLCKLINFWFVFLSLFILFSIAAAMLVTLFSFYSLLSMA